MPFLMAPARSYMCHFYDCVEHKAALNALLVTCCFIGIIYYSRAPTNSFVAIMRISK